MLTIWMGRANTGKSARIMNALRTRREQALLLVPEHASHTAELEVCRACGPGASGYVEVLSLRTLAKRVLALTGTAADGYLQLLPGIHSADGFFIAVFRRKGNMC